MIRLFINLVVLMGVYFYPLQISFALAVPRKVKYDDWNRVLIRAVGSNIEVHINGNKVSSIDTDKFSERGRRPDGTKHKFGVIKDLPWEGYLGFQDHGAMVWYKNVKAREIK